MTDRAGNLARHYESYAFGKQWYADATCSFNVSNRYTGQILDEDNGLYYYNARYYDPELGRFIQPDSIVPNAANPQDLNRYAYTRNNPMNRVDPSGHAGRVEDIGYGSRQIGYPWALNTVNSLAGANAWAFANRTFDFQLGTGGPSSDPILKFLAWVSGQIDSFFNPPAQPGPFDAYTHGITLQSDMQIPDATASLNFPTRTVDLFPVGSVQDVDFLENATALQPDAMLVGIHVFYSPSGGYFSLDGLTRGDLGEVADLISRSPGYSSTSPIYLWSCGAAQGGVSSPAAQLSAVLANTIYASPYIRRNDPGFSYWASPGGSPSWTGFWNGVPIGP